MSAPEVLLAFGPKEFRVEVDGVSVGAGSLKSCSALAKELLADGSKARALRDHCVVRSVHDS